MRLVAYLRRSTEKQEDSLGTQESIIREYSTRNNHELVRLYTEEAISGAASIDRRPALAQLVADVKSKARDFDGIIVVRLDRLARNPGTEYALIEILDRHKCELVSVNDPLDRTNPAGRFLAGVMSHARAFERELVGERTRQHNAARALAGKWPCSTPPLGLTYDKATGKLSPNDRADDVAAIFAEYIRSGGSTSATVRWANTNGILTRDGNLWRTDTLVAVLRNQTYRRRVTYDGRAIDAPDLIPEIVPPETTEAADRFLAINQRVGTRARWPKSVYSGLLRCGVCGGRLSKAYGPRGYVNWRCTEKQHRGLCPGMQISNQARFKLKVSVLARP